MNQSTYPGGGGDYSPEWMAEAAGLPEGKCVGCVEARFEPLTHRKVRGVADGCRLPVCLRAEAALDTPYFGCFLSSSHSLWNFWSSGLSVRW